MAKSSFQHLLSLLLLALALQLSSCQEPNPYPYPSPVGDDCTNPNPPPPLTPPVINQTIKANINKVVAKLVASVPKTKFATASYGTGGSAIYGLLQCRADVNSTDCANCAKEAKAALAERCAMDGKARLWFQHCYLRYDTTKFFGKLDRMDYYITYNNGPNAADAKAFQATVGKLMAEVTAKAVAPGKQALGTGVAKVGAKTTVYGLAECTRDLPASVCSGCLATAVSKFQTCCVGKERGLVLFGSCKVEYEVYPFFFPVKA
ncbi:cysteine-rich repeat secretory protein 38-like [Nymphaea colorata]|uniref:Gnk2-homologous domain-containing protein n=1 Tax=Nymphaea colorata TaxID=210225 RepID=A0A5K0WXD9_9MAGN|nr:cysteine-rich repeat secretory protein 38-like [Nymphaea colorata]